MTDTTGRRYDDKEIAAIFRAAADGPQPPGHDVPRDEGLTLAELQVIGREVGLSPEAVTRAARSLDVRGDSRKILGLQVGVARTVDLNRRLSCGRKVRSDSGRTATSRFSSSRRRPVTVFAFVPSMQPLEIPSE
jgi:hypothetical protein